MLDLNLITKILLLSSNEVALIPIIIFGFLSIDRKIFGHATILLMSILMINSFLKDILEAPLSEHFNQSGYTLPSENMSNAIILYGWLILNIKNNLIRFILGILILGIGFSLIYKEHNNIYDIIGSLFFCSILLVIYWWLAKTKTISDTPFLLGYLMICFGCGILWYFNAENIIPDKVLMAFMVLVGFTISWSFFYNAIKANPTVLSSVIGFLCIMGAYFLLLKLNLIIQLPYDFHWIIIGILIPTAAKATSGASLKK